MPTSVKPFKILLLGGPERAGLMEEMGRQMGLNLRCANPVGEHTSMRDLARGIAESGAARGGGEDNPLHQLLLQGDWDVILLRQFAPSAGLQSTFNGDVDCLMDYFADFCPGAKVYWDMPWAFEANSSVFPGYFNCYYNSSQSLMFNSIVRCVEHQVLDGEFGHCFAGWIPTGAVIQRLRQVWGRELTVDGFHLDDWGQWADALTALHVLMPQASLSDLSPRGDGKQWSELLEAVDFCCKELPNVPALLEEPEVRNIEHEGKPGDFTALQVPAPLELLFPDMVRLKDGRLLMGVYEHNCHAPHSNAKTQVYAQQGAGRILVLEGSADGKHWDYEHPLLVVDEVNMAKWGMAQTRGRYERLKRGETDYCIISDPRDPNLGLVYADATGNGEKDEIVVLTVWMCNYYPHLSDHQVFTIQSADGGRTWFPPQEMEREDGCIPLKRGDIAVFDNGEILFPYYSLRRESSRVGALHLKWDVQTKRWQRIGDYAIPNFAPWEGNSYNFNAVSLVVPDPKTDVVYGFVRERGSVICSQNRGKTWQEVGLEPGLIHQPGFAIVDGCRVFTTWARSVLPRTIYGKLFCPKAGWSHSLTQEIYASPDTAPHDMADPSCLLLADGRILVFCYDVTYRSIVGDIIDPEEERFKPVELQSSIPSGVLAGGSLDGQRLDGCVKLMDEVPESCTATIRAVFQRDGVLVIELGQAGRAKLHAGCDGLPCEGECTLHYAVVGQVAWLRPEGQDDWVEIPAAAQPCGFALEGHGVSVGQWTLSRRMVIGLASALNSIEKGQDVTLEPTFNPEAACVTWRSDDPDVASVSEDGVVAVHGVGRTAVTVNADGVEATCVVDLQPACREMTETGKTVFADHFADNPAGENSFWQNMADHGYEQGAYTPPGQYRSYDITDGHLMLRSGVSTPCRFSVATPFVGAFTLAFDFYFTHPRTGKSSILTMPGQMFSVDLFAGSSVHGVVQLTPEGVRIQHRPEGGTKNVEWPPKFCWDIQYPVNRWHHAKIAKIDGGILVKVWPKGEQELDKWNYTLMSPELSTDQPACVGMEYQVELSMGQYFAMDHLVITQTGV